MITSSNPPPIYMVYTPPFRRIPQESRQLTPTNGPEQVVAQGPACAGEV
jgi:hypothetical protein